jgi:hypothetical protein
LRGRRRGRRWGLGCCGCLCVDEAHGGKSRLQWRGNPYRWSNDATDETTTWDHPGPGSVGVRVWHGGGGGDEGSTVPK